MKLVVIEGPGKRDTLKKYLGSGFDVVATKGHIRDLPAKEMAIDFNNNFEPKYEVMPDKKDVINELQTKAKKADCVLLATDPDREGEAISWHIANILGLDPNSKCRIEFNEISENVVKNAVDHPRAINMQLVDAQQARRVLDRIVGYKVSPIICKKIKPKLSAGRVQSVALKLVVEREREIQNFVPEEYWIVSSILNKTGDKLNFKANLTTCDKKKIKPKNKEEVDQILADIKDKDYVVESIKKTTTKSKPNAPFTTSTMQQDASSKLGFDTSKTSKLAQVLYEGVELKGEGKVALITYIRTDSVRVSEEASIKARAFIENKFGKDYVPSRIPKYESKKNAQDAHETIRPININRTPEAVKDSLTPDAYKLYKLIYDRFLASQMAEAVYHNVIVDINCSKYGFKATGKTLAFAGFTACYKAAAVEDEKEEFSKIPPLAEGDKLDLKEIKTEQKFTKPPQRYNDGTLVKAMEEKGIGRPATYAPTIAILVSREYVKREGKFFVPTELGCCVTDYLEANFKPIMNIAFTARMETQLDNIAEGTEKWQELIETFWNFFAPILKKADVTAVKIKVPPQETDIVCDKCGAKMVIREGRYGKFLGCSNFPKCNNMKKLEPEKKNFSKVVGVCPKCGKDVVTRKSKRGKIFYACSGYPNCDFVSWDRPTGKLCPKCKSHLVYAAGDKVKCSNTECDYVE